MRADALTSEPPGKHRDLNQSKTDKMKKKHCVQMKEQGRSPQNQINEGERGKLAEKEFRVMRIKMMRTLKSRMEKII